MVHRPSFEEFVELGQQYSVVPVYRQLIADMLTPVAAFELVREGDWSFLFESVVGGERVSRYTFFGSQPYRRFVATGHSVREQLGTADWLQTTHADPLKLLEERIAAYRGPEVAELPRFYGGVVGYAGYDTVRYVEHLPNCPTDDRGLPDLCFGFYDRMVIFDNIHKTVFVVAQAILEADTKPKTEAAWRKRYDEICAKVDDCVTMLRQPSPNLPVHDLLPSEPGALDLEHRYESNFSKAKWLEMIARGIEYINAGDIFQYVPSQRFQTQTQADSYSIYRALRVINPSPFMFYLNFHDFTLVGASPEIMCRVESGEMTVRPLAGTRRRGKTVEEDEALAAELLADPKERAEHIMLVDLGRNDVGKVCELGSVQLLELLHVERYSHVMHISSTVQGRLKHDRSAFDALRSALPAGTLSGAPKVRAMQVIDEFEPHKRGPYGGAVGYVDYRGNMDTCIALRTLVIQGETAYIQAGCGVVADSDAEAEFQETVNKAKGLMRAIEVAEAHLTSPTSPLPAV